MKLREFFWIGIILFVQSLLSIAGATVPKMVNYQGKITDPSGVALTGSCNLVFKIYDVETGGSPLWQEIHPSASVDHGLFDVILGSITPLDIPFDDLYYIEIAVNGETMTPRLPLLSTPYSLRADFAEHAIYTDSIHFIDSVQFIDSVAYIDSVTHIAMVHEVTFITYIDSISFIDSVSYINFLNEVTFITYIDSITHIDSVSYVDSISFIDSIAFIDSVAFIDSIHHIDSIGYIDSIDYIDHVGWADSVSHRHLAGPGISGLDYNGSETVIWQTSVDNSSISLNVSDEIEIKNGGIVNAHIADETIRAGKLSAAGALDGYVLKNITGVVAWAPDETGSGGDGNDQVKADATDPIAGYLSAKVDNSTIEVDFALHRLQVKDGGIQSAHIQDGTIMTADLNTASFANWDQDASNDLTIATVFGGDVSGIYDNLQLGSGVVGTSELADDAILEIDLDATNIAVDNYVLTFDNISGGFTWINPTSIGTDNQVDNEVPLTTTGDFTIISGETEVHGALDDLDAQVAANETDITAHVAADGDLSGSNEYNISMGWIDATNTVSVTDGGGTVGIPITGFADASHTHSTLTDGSGIIGGSYNGGTAKTWAINTGDGIDIVSDAVAVDVTDFAGNGLGEDASNNLIVNTGAGLEIVGDAVKLTNTGAAGGYTNANITVDAQGRITTASSGSSGTSGSGTANYVTKWTAVTTLGDSQIFDNGTNVGIGIAAPSAKLDVNGTAEINGNLNMQKNQITNMCLENRTDDPSSPSVGQIWIRTDL